MKKAEAVRALIRAEQHLRRALIPSDLFGEEALIVEASVGMALLLVKEVREQLDWPEPKGADQ